MKSGEKKEMQEIKSAIFETKVCNISNTMDPNLQSTTEDYTGKVFLKFFYFRCFNVPSSPTQLVKSGINSTQQLQKADPDLFSDAIKPGVEHGGKTP